MSEKPAQHSPTFDLVKGITDSAFIVDRDRNVTEYNRSFANLQKVDRKNLRGIKGTFCRKFVNMEICEKDCIVLKSLESGATVRFDEVKGKTLASEDLNLIVTAIPIRNEQGEIVSVLEMHRDVTDEERIHEKYKIFLDKEKKAKEELERQVEERTKELKQTNAELKKAEAQLVHSEKMSSLGQMVAGIAHELNNPINFIYGNVESIRDYVKDVKLAVDQYESMTASDPKLKLQAADVRKKQDLDYIFDDLPKVVKSIQNGSERAAEIIKGLRTFSRLDEANLKETNLHEDIDVTLTLLRSQYKDHITIHKEYGDLPLVNCHSGQLNQVFMNLLQNAIHAIEKQGDIWIRTRVEEGNAVVEIQDSGCGIPGENMGKIFDPFFTSKEIGKGTGLGLSISYGIVEKHKGKIEVESKVGEGTTFRVKIPLNH